MNNCLHRTIQPLANCTTDFNFGCGGDMAFATRSL